jgi:hypothetical protein
VKIQLEITWDKPEPLALVVEHATDGDRVTREAKQRDLDRKEAENKQEKLRDWQDISKQYEAV